MPGGIMHVWLCGFSPHAFFARLSEISTALLEDIFFGGGGYRSKTYQLSTSLASRDQTWPIHALKPLFQLLNTLKACRNKKKQTVASLQRTSWDVWGWILTAGLVIYLSFFFFNLNLLLKATHIWYLHLQLLKLCFHLKQNTCSDMNWQPTRKRK